MSTKDQAAPVIFARVLQVYDGDGHPLLRVDEHQARQLIKDHDAELL